MFVAVEGVANDDTTVIVFTAMPLPLTSSPRARQEREARGADADKRADDELARSSGMRSTNR